MTLRQLISVELEKAPMTARELSKTVRISEKEAVSHLEHVAKSLHPPRRLIIEPPFCHKCGFVFSERRRYTSPGRCPRCRHEGIQPPVFRIDSG